MGDPSKPGEKDDPKGKNLPAVSNKRNPDGDRPAVIPENLPEAVDPGAEDVQSIAADTPEGVTELMRLAAQTNLTPEEERRIALFSNVEGELLSSEQFVATLIRLARKYDANDTASKAFLEIVAEHMEPALTAHITAHGIMDLMSFLLNTLKLDPSEAPGIIEDASGSKAVSPNELARPIQGAQMATRILRTLAGKLSSAQIRLSKKPPTQLIGIERPEQLIDDFLGERNRRDPEKTIRIVETFEAADVVEELKVGAEETGMIVVEPKDQKVQYPQLLETTRDVIGGALVWFKLKVKGDAMAAAGASHAAHTGLTAVQDATTGDPIAQQDPKNVETIEQTWNAWWEALAILSARTEKMSGPVLELLGRYIVRSLDQEGSSIIGRLRPAEKRQFKKLATQFFTATKQAMPESVEKALAA